MLTIEIYDPGRRNVARMVRSFADALEKLDPKRNDGGPIYAGKKIIGVWAWQVEEVDPNKMFLKRGLDGKYRLTPVMRRFNPKMLSR